jgi:hypothetical protein
MFFAAPRTENRGKKSSSSSITNFITEVFYGEQHYPVLPVEKVSYVIEKDLF